MKGDDWKWQQDKGGSIGIRWRFREKMQKFFWRFLCETRQQEMRIQHPEKYGGPLRKQTTAILSRKSSTRISIDWIYTTS